MQVGSKEYNEGQEVVPSVDNKGGVWISGISFAYNTYQLL